MPAEPLLIGWDVGGAHLKACLYRADAGGLVLDVAQWACPLWQGLHHLDAALSQARARWPQALAAPQAVTMTGEMTDLFLDRADGVAQISRALQRALPGPVQVYAGPAPDEGPGRARWVPAAEAGGHWAHIASANWLATAQHAAAVVGHGLLIDIGSTTTDLIVLSEGQPLTRSQSDRDRLACGELAYHGVVRTPVCALGPQVPLQGQSLNVMNEWFATSADVYRLCGELDPEHDLYPAADQGAKDLPATRQRLARMVGCDVRDASDADWAQLAHHWRQAQLGRMANSLARVLAQPGAREALSRPGARAVAAGAGAFLVPDLLRLRSDPQLCALPVTDYGHALVRVARPAGTAPGTLARWAQVCAPSVAVAALRAQALY